MGISLFVNIFYRIYIMTPWAPHCYQVYNRIDVRTPVHCSSFIVEQVGAIVFYIITAFCFLILYNFKTKRRVLGVVRIPKQNGS